MEQEGTDLAATVNSPLRRGNVTLGIGPGQLSSFFPLLQRGVVVPAMLGGPLKELLTKQFGIPEEYVTGRITTIFLDNHPVDDLERSLIHEGSRVTLSAAMPGLVGAMMRRSGILATLRQGISHAEQGGDLGAGQGTLKLKLFNLLLAEIGPLVLARGILLQRNELDGLFGGGDPLGRDCITAWDLCEPDAGDAILLRVNVREV